MTELRMAVCAAITVSWCCSLPQAYSADHVLVQWSTQQLCSEFYGEGAAVGDLNRDGHLDIVSGPFWYAGPDYRQRSPIHATKAFDPLNYSDNFFCFVEDFNGDDWPDVLVYGFPGTDASWFENPRGLERDWQRYVVLDRVDNESPTFVDLTGDGHRDIVCSSGGYFGYAEVNRADPTARWEFHRISDQSAGDRFTHGLGVGDINADGRLDLLEKSGWWEQPLSLDGDPLWQKHAVAFSERGGAQMFAYDLDGDGDQDVLTSLDAHGFGLAWYEQVAQAHEREFIQHEILPASGWRAAAAGSDMLNPDDPRIGSHPYGINFSQLHAVELVDIDGDGVKDIVTGKRHWAHGPHGDPEPNGPAVLYWLQTQRTMAQDGTTRVSFVPWRIHGASGVGVDVKAADVNGDGRPDITVGNKLGTFISIQRRKTVSEKPWQRAQPMRLDQIARPANKSLPDNEGLSPRDAAAAMTVPAGFQVQLAAAEPSVHQPVAFTLDERGRLWVAEAHSYPQRAAPGEGRDRIIILEDDNQDGVFEKRKVFIEGLNLVSGLEVGFGGVWVGAAPYLMFIPDRDRNDVPDGPASGADDLSSPGLAFPEDVPAGATVLLDGFGWEDTHETLNSLIWGPDGWLYGCHGVFTRSQVGRPGTPENQRIGLNAGVWRYHPVRHEFEVFAHGTSNPWGIDFDDRGQAFVTACVIPHLFHVIQGGRYQRQAGQHFNPYTYEDLRTIADHSHYAGNIGDHAWWDGRNQAAAHQDTQAAGGGHAHCGAMIYLGDNWPLRYRNTLFMSNIHGNRINNDVLTRRGSGFVGSHGYDFLYANDRWFRGINLKYGPDGTVYLIDWYDKNACHRLQPEIWDRSNGRIYRVAFGPTPARRVNLADRSDVELADLHLHENEWWVRTSRRILMERAAAASWSAERSPVVDSSQVDLAARQRLRHILFAEGHVTRRLRALWTLHAIDAVDPADWGRLLADREESIRAWAIQLGVEHDRIADVQHSFQQGDPSAVVRLSLAAALPRLPVEGRWSLAERLVTYAEDADDHNLPWMVWYGVEPLVANDPDRALSLAKRSKLEKVSRFIYRRMAADDHGMQTLLTALGTTDTEETQRMILHEIVNALRTRGRVGMPTSWPDAYARLAHSSAADIRGQARFITVKFGDHSIFPALREILADSTLPTTERLPAMEALVGGKDQAVPPVLHQLLDDPALRGAALRALASFDHPATPAEILSRYNTFTAQERVDAVTTLSSRVNYAMALVDAVDNKFIPRGDLSAFSVGQMQRLHDDPLIARLKKVWGTVRPTAEDRQQQIAELKTRFTDDYLLGADRSLGRAVFHKTCAQCHRLFGEGADTGPDLTGSNRADLDYILQNILDPSALVGHDYQMTVVVTVDGRVVSGVIKEEHDSAIVLQTVNEAVVIDKADIEEQSLSPLSLMPEGQLEQLTADEARDLIAYLASPTQVPLPSDGPEFNERDGRVQGAIEGETMQIVSLSAGEARSQPMAAFTADRWSGNSQLWWTGAQPGARLVLEIPVATSGRYELWGVMTKAHDYAVVQLRLDDAIIGQPIDLFSADVVTTGVLSLGTHELSESPHHLTIEVTGANPQAVGAYMFGLDYLYLTPRPDGD